ncbi:hypothetical protein ES703_114213 [subsurface metagenome]
MGFLSFATSLATSLATGRFRHFSERAGMLGYFVRGVGEDLVVLALGGLEGSVGAHVGQGAVEGAQGEAEGLGQVFSLDVPVAGVEVVALGEVGVGDDEGFDEVANGDPAGVRGVDAQECAGHENESLAEEEFNS